MRGAIGQLLILFAIAALALALAPAVRAATTDTSVSAVFDPQPAPGSLLQITGEAFSSGQSQNNSAVAVFLYGNSSALVASNSSNTAANGLYNVTLQLPNYHDNFTLIVDSAVSGIPNASFDVKATYFQSATFSFIGSLPPFSPGKTFTVQTNATYANSTPLASVDITLQVFKANGVNVSWGGPLANTTQSTGLVTHTFTIPATETPGEYLISAGAGGGGVAALFFTVKSYVVSVTTVNSAGDPTTGFGTAQSPVIQVKVQDTNGTAVGGATVTATTSFPNGTVANATVIPESAQTGLHNITLKNTSLGGEGVYTVSVTASIGGTTETTSGSFTMGSVRMTLSPSEFGGFFQEFAGKQTIAPGSNLSLDLKAFDLSTGEAIAGALSPATNQKQMNCSSVTIINVTNAATGAAVPQINTSSTQVLASQKFAGKNTCTLNILSTATAGTFQVVVNASINATGSFLPSQAVGFFSTQDYVMQVSPVSAFGNDEFALTKPGNNATFAVQILKLSDGALQTPGNITNFVVDSMTPLGSFSFGSQTAITNVSYWNASADGVAALTTNGKFILTVPTSASGPTLISMRATVGGQDVKGSTFIMAAYLMGFAGPVGGGVQSGGGPGGDGGPGGGPSGDFGGGMAYCADPSAPISMFAFVMDVETTQPKGGAAVTLDGIHEEFSGKDVTSCFSTTGNITGSTDGKTTFSMSIVNASCASSLSGFYFGLFNVKWQNLTDKIPGGFQCKSLNFWPQISTFQIGKNSTVSIQASNVKYLQNISKSITNGTVTIQSLFAFDPDKGPTQIDVSGSGAASFNISAASATFNLTPSNLTDLVTNNGGNWYNGFYDAKVRVCGNANDSTAIVCDTASAGWQVFPFQAFPVGNVWGDTYSINDTKSIGVFSDEAITTVNISWMTFKNGQKTKFANIVCGDNYNTSSPSCMRFNPTNVSASGPFNVTVNFTIPATLAAGNGIVELRLTGVSGDAVPTGIFTDLKGLFTGVVVPGALRPADPNIADGLVSYPFENIQPGQVFSAGSDTLNLSNWNNGSKANDDYLLAWNLTAVAVSTNGTSNFTIGPGVQGFCAGTDPFNRSVQFLAVPNTSTGQINDNQMMVFFKQNSTVGDASEGVGTTFIGPYTVGKNVNGSATNASFATNESRHYISGFEFCMPSFIATTQADYSLVSQQFGQQLWSTQFSFLGRGKTNAFMGAPFVMVSGTTGVPGASINIQGIQRMTDDKVGLGSPLNPALWQKVPGTTDTNGFTLVKVNVSQAGFYKFFWNASKTSGSVTITDTANFQSAPVGEFASFSAFGQILGQGGQSQNEFTVSKYQPVTVTVNASYFNGTQLPNGNVTVQYMDFSSNFGPPTVGIPNATNSSGATKLIPIIGGGALFSVTPSGGWPQGQFGSCVDVMGTVNATDPSGNGGPMLDENGAALGTTNYYAGRVCTAPTG